MSKNKIQIVYRTDYKSAVKIIIVAVSLAVMLLSGYHMLTQNSGSGEKVKAANSSPSAKSIEILKSSIYPGLLIKYDWGHPIKLLIYTDAQGEILTAFNTCAKCFDRGDIDFTLIDSLLHCSGCTTTTDISQFGQSVWGGCRPVSIPVHYRADTEDVLVIPGDLLFFATTVFARWESGDFTPSLSSFNKGL